MSETTRTTAPDGARAAPPAFTVGSTMRHVAVMTATGSLGLVAIFIVDFLNLFYIAMLGQEELAAAIGYAGTLLFFLISVGIGFTIAAAALVSRALGAGDRPRARRLAGSSLALAVGLATLMSAALWPLLAETLTLLGATGPTHAIALDFLRIVLPSTPIMVAGMILAAILRAVGDARRAMMVTLSGGVVAAIADPLLIFALDLGVTGAAIATLFARLALVAVGLHGAVRVHDLVARPRAGLAFADAPALAAIAVPAVLTNVATPAGNAYVTAALAPFGDGAVAGWAVIGRLVPVAFGALFALSGAIGPILGQNLGARRYDRVRQAMTDSFLLVAGYSLVAWALLFLLRGQIIAAFGIAGDAAMLVDAFCTLVAGTFLFAGTLFVANAAFNNLGYPVLSTLFNWGKATLGTVPFVWVGADLAGAWGVLVGQGVGGALFGLAALVACYRVTGGLAARERGREARQG